MAFDKGVWAAFTLGGVYHTSYIGDATEPQPIWEAVNDGLGSINLMNFCLDMSEPVCDSRMFCIDSTTQTLWRRVTGGVWTSILTSAAARAIVGAADDEKLRSVITDPTTGYVYAIMVRHDNFSYHWVMRSTDNGGTWAGVAATTREFWYGTLCNLDAHDGLVTFTAARSPLGSRAYYSVDHGITWHYIAVVGGNHNYNVINSHCDANIWYGGTRGWYALSKYDAAAGTVTYLAPSANPGPYACAGAMWLDETDPNTFVVLRLPTPNVRFALTQDGGASWAQDNVLPNGSLQRVADNCDFGYWILGTVNADAVTGKEIIYISDDHGVTISGKSGALWDTPPYTDSIPATAEAICNRGLWAVPGAPVIATVPIIPPFVPTHTQKGLSVSVFRPRIVLNP